MNINNAASYAARLQEALKQVLTDEENENFIDFKEVLEDDNLTDLMYALLAIVPTTFYNGVTKQNKTNLEVNHIANQLVMQYAISMNNNEDR